VLARRLVELRVGFQQPVGGRFPRLMPDAVDLGNQRQAEAFGFLADGVSLFSYPLRIQDATDAEEDNFSSAQISRDTLVSLEITSRGGNPGSGVTVGLELEDA